MSIGQYLKDSLTVAFNPGQFYRYMPKTGGLVGPAFYVLTMSVLAVVLCAIGALFSSESSFFGVLFGHLVPHIIKVFITVAVASVALFFLWQRLGSNESFETSCRSVAYAAVISPIWIVLAGVLGVIGKLIAVIWLIAILVAASAEVHGIQRRPAIVSLVGLAVLLALFQWFSLDDDPEHGLNELSPGDKKTQPSEITEPEKMLDEERLIEQASETLLSGSGGESEPETLTPSEQELLPLSTKETDKQETLLEERAEQAGEVLGEFVQELDSSVGQIGEKLVTAAEDFKEGYAQQEQSDTENIDDPAADVPEEDQSVAKSAGAALSNVVEGVEDVIAGVKQGYEKATASEGVEESVEPLALQEEPVEDKEASLLEQEGVSGEELDSPEDDALSGQDQETLTPEQLGEAMAAFLHGVDQAVEQSSGEIEETGESVADAFGRFLESFNEALERKSSEETKQ